MKTRHRLVLVAGMACLALASAGLSGVATAATAVQPYHLVKKVTLGGSGGWDYFAVEPGTHRLFIARDTHMMIVGPDGHMIKDVSGMNGAHAIAFAPKLGRAFTSNGRAHSVTVFDLKTLLQARDIPIPGRDPDGILYEPASNRVFTFNGRADDATAIDASTATVVGRVELPGRPETAQADGTGKIYVNIADKSELSELDAKTLRVLHTWPMAPCEDPAGLAIDVAHHRLFAGCRNGLMAVIDYTTGKVVAHFPIGQGNDAARFDPGTQLAFASCGDGTITVAHEDSPDKYTVVQTIHTQRGARTMALDRVSHQIYTVTSKLGPAPPPTAQRPHPYPTLVPNTFTLFIYSQ
ncbi:MAG TPA: YncE family protein [Vicinamibacterales bacterium]|nr:YncE family protein [Vicinamibacterales bacterium]